MLLGYYNKNQEFKELNTWTEYKKYPNIKNSPINIYDLNQKLIFSTNIVLYMCSFCKQTHKTTFITFRNRYLKYKNYEYLCVNCVKRNCHLSEEEKKLKAYSFKEKQLITKTKNKTTPKDLIDKGKKYGFLNLEQTKNSFIRNKMNETKLINDSNTNIGTKAYYKRLETYNKLTEIDKKRIVEKQLITKTKNKTTPKDKFLRGETFGFVNMSENKRKLMNEKIKLILNKKDENNIKYIELICQKRIEKMRLEGKLIKLEELPDYFHYLIKVRRLTEKVYKIYKNIINPHNFKRSKKDFHLDHKFSIKDGFINNVPIHIICSKENLTMLNYKENLFKSYKSSLTLNELYINCYQL